MLCESQSIDENDFLVHLGELSLAYHTFEAGIPLSLAKKSSALGVRKIDLTETCMRNFENLQYFTRLETLIVDKNNLTDLLTCPPLPSLRTLWCNNNNISDLPAFFDDISSKFPGLQHLSMMRNPGCPGLMDIVNPDLEAIRLYRLYVLYRYPQLQMLDCEHVTNEERAEAKIRGQYAIKKRALSVPSPLPAIAVAAGADVLLVTSVSERDSDGSPDATAGSIKAGGTIKVSAPRGNSKNSEGNRFIVNSQL